MNIQKEYISRSHSRFLIKYHMIFVCKYRKQVLANRLIDKDIKRAMTDTANKSDFEIEVMETDKDHIHILISSEPKLSPLQIARKLKQASTTVIWKQHPDILRRIYWREHTFWTDGYFVATTGSASQETIQRYIENQG